LSVVGLADAMHKRPTDLSPGMRQRVGVARAFALKSKMLLLDEPFGMLDSLTRFELQQVPLDLWQKNNITSLMVTHDVDEAVFLPDRVVMMTNSPTADVGDILEIKCPQPRDRKSFTETPKYYEYREHLITFLNERSHLRGDERPLIARGICPGSGGSLEPEPAVVVRRNVRRGLEPSLNRHNGRQFETNELHASRN